MAAEHQVAGKPLPLGGTCAPRFAPLREAFIANFTTLAEPGAAITLYHRGQLVADLWGGWRDPEREQGWQRDTLVNFFSVGKPLASLVILRLVARGMLALDAPVGHVWPELAQGAGEVTLRHILSHQAGLPAIDAPLAPDAMLDPACMVAALEDQSPWWQPGQGHGYHVNTFGLLLGEVARRATGKTLGTLFREEIAQPLDLDVYFGVPVSEHHRIADFLWPAGGHVGAMPEGFSEMQRMRWKTYWNPSGFSGAGFINSPSWRLAELPSTNGHGTARGVARLYAALAAGGALEGVNVLDKALLDEATSIQSDGPDLVLERHTRFGLGFQLPHPERLIGPNPGAFGHFGAGGSLAFCDPDAGLAFAYVTNDMGPRWQNPRNAALINAIYDSVT